MTMTKRKTRKNKTLQKKQIANELARNAAGRHVVDNQVDVDEEDEEFYGNCFHNLDFLTDLSENKLSNAKLGQKRKLKRSEEEAEYEKLPRMMADDPLEHQQVLLPYKGKKGVIQRVGAKSEVIEDGENETTNAVAEGDTLSPSGSCPSPPVRSVVELFSQRQQKLNNRKEQIAELSNKVMENPDEHIDQLKELCSYCEEKDVDIRITTRKLAMLSILAVFKDIVPGYHLRLPTEKEKEVKVSKDVRKLRDYEEGLLLTYQRYLQILERTAQVKIKKKKKESEINCSLQKNMHQSLVSVAVHCQCDLMTNLSHFNYHTNLMAVLVPRMNDDDEHGQVCCEAFKRLFKEDITGDVSLEAVKLISKYVKSQGYRVKPCVLEIFLLLRINEMDILALRDGSNSSRGERMKGHNRKEKIMKGRLSKRDRKRQKEMKKLDKELQEAQAVESHRKIAKTHTEILKFIFLTYFRVLKNAPQSPLLPPVLEGLGKYAHLINLDFFADLMVAMDSVTAKDLSLRETLNCVLTAFKILSGQGEALNIDPRGFYCTLYTSLLRLSSGSSSGDVDVAIQCLEVMMQKRRKQVPMQRVAAFTKRLSTLGLHVMPNSSLALLSFVRVFFQVFPRSQTLLDSESLGMGLFRPEVEDPEMSNTESTACWDLSYLALQHYHPTVRSFASTVMTGKGPAAQLARISPVEFYKSYDASEMKLNPDIQECAPSKISRTRRSLPEDLGYSSLNSAIDSATKFTEDSLKQVRFAIPSL